MILMTVSTHQVSEEFDRIARLTERMGGKGGDAYDKYLLRRLPLQCESALDVGCGMGAFTRLLAERARQVTALDLSPQMIRLARERSGNNINYLLGDFLKLSLPAESFDYIVSINTLHHLPLAQTVEKMKGLLKPNGVLVIQDLIANDGLFDLCASAIAVPVSISLRFLKTGRLWPPKELREAWNEHGKGERYLTIDEVKKTRALHLPGASVHRHLLWRYTLVWRKSGA
jgi:2-polyprenyl-3-methyl-5-hydroxy-6-metoxy-1,4-benzoquinol methylase